MEPIVSIRWLLARLYEPELVIVDCRFLLSDSEAGRKAYTEDHIPGAIYLHLEEQLSAPISTHGGRHPLPDISTFTTTLSKVGINRGSIVIAYDDQGGAYASRLWWMLRYLGHERVYVMDEGYSAWKNAKFPVSNHQAVRIPSQYESDVQHDMLVSMEDVRDVVSGGNGSVGGSVGDGERGGSVGDGGGVEDGGSDSGGDGSEARHDEGNRGGSGSAIIIDSREARRYAGLEEPIDSKAGHIPGAINMFWKDVLDENGRWRSAEVLKKHYKELDAEQEVIVYCGSGVTACPNVLALERAGYKNVKLYAGSWSDWISYPENQVATGE